MIMSDENEMPYLGRSDTSQVQVFVTSMPHWWEHTAREGQEMGEEVRS